MLLLLFSSSDSISALTSFVATSHPLGSEAVIRWTYPTTRPADYQLLIFKKESAVTAADISDYILHDITASGLTVFDCTGSDQKLDFDCENGNEYYYSAVIYSDSAGKYSAAVNDSIVISFTASQRFVDTKSVVINAIKAVMANYSATSEKDYQITNSFSIQNVKPPLISVTRQGIVDAQRFYGNVLFQESQLTHAGKIEDENILVIWEDPNANRRDTLTNIFRVNEVTIARHIKKNSEAIDVKITFGSDDLDLRFTDIEMHLCQMNIRIVSPVYLTHAPDTRKLPLHEVSEVQISEFEFVE